MIEAEPTRAAGLRELAAFAPHAGRVYAAGRNADPGPGGRQAVSMLSPYLRHRLILEEEAVAAALREHGPHGAEKFVQEVFWRTYWKGYLEARPSLWAGYRAGVRRAQDRLATEGGLRRVHDDAVAGRTGIACFDDWARALVSDNWLHNHVRMWFASIWIFTLRLPWELGADFFMRHLLDGDPASNTLSWRWVGGLHTVGKHYLARADNIARNTGGRYNPRGELDEAAAPLTEDTPAAKGALPIEQPLPEGDVALLLHEDDCVAETLDLGRATVRAIGIVTSEAGRASHGVADPVAAFVLGATEDAAGRAAEKFGVTPVRVDAGGMRDLAAGRPIVCAQAPVGPAADALAPLRPVMVRRTWDAATWPRAQRGFFQVKDRIPAILAQVGAG